jgi:apolipoprotein N-acyltransferase
MRVVRMGGVVYHRRCMNIPSGQADSPRVAAPGHIVMRAWPWAAAVASGGLLTLCLEPWNQAWLCWLALTPLLAALWSTGGGGAGEPQPRPGEAAARPRTRFPRFVREPWARAFALGYIAGLVFFWGAFSWLWQVTGPGWFLLGPYMACYFAVWGVFMATVAKPRWRGTLGSMPWPANRSSFAAAAGIANVPASPFLRSRWNLWVALLGASAWVALEWVRGWLLSGFGWNELGVSLHANIALIQIAEWTGVGGLSFLAAFVNIIAIATVYRFAAEIRTHKIRPHFDFTLTLAGLLMVFSFGLSVLQKNRRAAAEPGATAPLRVAAVQANIPQSDNWAPAWQAVSFKSLRELSATAIATRPDLLLWPEAATPRGVFGDKENYDFVMEIAAQAHTNFLLGTLDYDFGPDGRAQADYNAAIFLPKGGGDVQVYRKIHLVPFGEYVPYRHQFPPLAWLVGSQVPSDLTSGREAVDFETADPPVRLGPLICFEDTLGELTRQPVLLGAQLLITITNDAWFGRTAASHQHLAEATFRTVENRRPLVRCANNGVTAFLDSDGRVTQSLVMADGTVFGPGVLAGAIAVPLRPKLTFYTRHGEMFSVLCSDVAGLAALMMIWRRLRRLELRRRTRRQGASAPPSAPAEILP